MRMKGKSLIVNVPIKSKIQRKYDNDFTAPMNETKPQNY